jgi:hypothetical protein
LSRAGIVASVGLAMLLMLAWSTQASTLIGQLRVLVGPHGWASERPY